MNSDMTGQVDGQLETFAEECLYQHGVDTDSTVFKPVLLTH